MNNVDIRKYTRMVQCLWQSEPRNDNDPSIPIWCLGQKYLSSGFNTTTLQSGEHDNPGGDGGRIEQTPKLDANNSTNGTNESVDWPAAFLDDFESRIWITYRSDFPPIPKSDDPEASSAMTLSVRLRSQWVNSNGFTSDSGWGCMIRSGQSLLANALSILTLGRDWRRDESTDDELPLISLFADDPRAPFSIHRFVETGAAHCGKYPGQWFGPSATATCIQKLVNEVEDHPLVNVYVSVDSPDVYENKIYDIASRGPQKFNPTLILLGVRLGLDRINPVYWEALASLLQMSQSVGIAGGRPSSSLYFVGVQGHHFFYLDPHCTRIAPHYDPSTKLSREELGTYHTRRLRRIHVEDMDPSMLLGFLVKDERDFQKWKDEICSAKYKTIIHVSDSQPTLPNVRYILRDSAVDEVEAFDDDEFDT